MVASCTVFLLCCERRLRAPQPPEQARGRESRKRAEGCRLQPSHSVTPLPGAGDRVGSTVPCQSIDRSSKLSACRERADAVGGAAGDRLNRQRRIDAADGGEYRISTDWGCSSALFSNTTAGNNTASGVNAIYSNTTGGDNTASGGGALYNSTTGVENTASGFLPGLTNITGSYDTFIGSGADANADYTNGTALGAGALLFCLQLDRAGNTSISAIYANVSSITAVSDRRRKKDIRALDTDLGLDFIEKLKPVSYRFNNGDETERYGFIAQDLEQALPASLRVIAA
jgi:hypothetical protein